MHAVEAWAAERRADYLASDTELDNTVSQAAHASVGLAEVERAVHFLKPIAPNPAEDLAGDVELRELDEASGADVLRLRVTPSQNDFVAPNVVSVAQASLTTDVLVFGIFVGETAVGFAMVSTREHRYYLWRFMIDAQHQGSGYGRAAMALVFDRVRAFPDGDRVFLSYVPGEHGPRGFYAKLGFEDTGRVQGGEHEMVLRLR